MEWIICAAIVLSVFKAAFSFNIDPVAWKTLSNDATGFGYQVVQRQSDLLVSAPLEQHSPDGRGQIYKCSTESCRPLTVSMPKSSVNMSLGLTMISDPATQNTLVCGPTIPKDCKSITMYQGQCVQIDKSDRVENPLPSSLAECPSSADIAFLLDGSGSVDAEDFKKMKDFVKNLVSSFLGKDTKFAIAQFSSEFEIHYYFNTFIPNLWRSQIDGIKQLGGTTYTAAAIKRVVNNIFNSGRGSRLNVKKVLIVITDGQSHDRNELQNAAILADRKKIVRFSIGVGNAFSRPDAKDELGTIASFPPANHMFQVQSFDALQRISESLQEKIFSIEGSQTGGESLKMEMSQEGFSAAYVPGEGYQVAIVGANQWRGGYKRYGRTSGIYEPTNVDTDSYLGMNMTAI